ncbi:MAG: prenyltransferase [Anaeromyxobacteraceae bacterium]
MTTRSQPTPGEGFSSTPPTHRRVWVDLLLYPTHTLPTAAAPLLVGIGIGIHERVPAPLPVLVAFLGSWFVHLAGVFTDNHELLRRHPGLEEHPELSAALRDGTLRLSGLRAAIALCLALALATAPWLYALGGAPVLVLGAVGVAASLAYHGWPVAYVRAGLADPVFLVLFGVVGVAGTVHIQFAAAQGAQGAAEPWRLLAGLPPATWWAGLPCGALVTSVMLVDDLRDRAWDRLKGWRTGAVRFGPRAVKAEITALVAFAVVGPVAAWLVGALGAGALATLAAAPLAIGAVRAVRTGETPQALFPVSPRMARLALVHSALLGLGLALAG